MRRGMAVFLLGIVMCGLHFHVVALQVYGWSGMLIEYRETSGSWAAALEKTLGGEAPCHVCHQVDEALVAIEEGADATMVRSEISFVPPVILFLAGRAVSVAVPPVAFSLTGVDAVLVTQANFTPAAPPPRSA